MKVLLFVLLVLPFVLSMPYPYSEDEDVQFVRVVRSPTRRFGGGFGNRYPSYGGGGYGGYPRYPVGGGYGGGFGGSASQASAASQSFGGGFGGGGFGGSASQASAASQSFGGGNGGFGGYPGGYYGR